MVYELYMHIPDFTDSTYKIKLSKVSASLKNTDACKAAEKDNALHKYNTNYFLSSNRKLLKDFAERVRGEWLNDLKEMMHNLENIKI